VEELRIGHRVQTEDTAVIRGVLAGKSGEERSSLVNYAYDLSRSVFALSLSFTQNYAFSTHINSVGVLGSVHMELITLDTFVRGSFILGI
jgi:hypothetical protein